MTPDERRRLYETASTPGEARKLLIAKGRPSLGAHVQLYRQCVRGSEEAFALHFEKISNAIESGEDLLAYFELAEINARPFTDKSRSGVVASLRWCATVWRRWGQRPREASEVEMIDKEIRRRGRGPAA